MNEFLNFFWLDRKNKFFKPPVDPHPIHSDGATRYLFFFFIKKVVWNGMEKWFSSFEKSVSDEERFCLESPRISYFYFFKGEKLSKNKNP